MIQNNKQKKWISTQSDDVNSHKIQYNMIRYDMKSLSALKSRQMVSLIYCIEQKQEKITKNKLKTKTDIACKHSNTTTVSAHVLFRISWLQTHLY